MDNVRFEEEILSIKGSFRNNLIFLKELREDLHFCNIGKELAFCLNDLKKNQRVTFAAKRELNKIFEEESREHPQIGKYLALKNIGILFEPDLKLDIKGIFQKHSKNAFLFIHWEGEIDNKEFYFLSKEKGILLNFDDTSHLVI